ncbi:MAG: sulfatase [Rikenellaceae bacterium]
MNKSLLTSLAATALVGTAVAEIPTRPNIIWLMAEDMGQDLECYGMKAVETPNLNMMAREGVQYNAACCTNPISSPSRSAMMTGLHQTITNSHNHRSNRDVPLDTKYKPFTYYLREAGYTTILGNSNVRNKGRKTDCNFQHEPIGEWDGVTNFGLFDKYDEFTAADQPFFAQIQLLVTHRGDWWNEVTAEAENPVDPSEVELPPYLPDTEAVRKEWASYLDQVERMDYEVGVILDELKTKGLLDNTIIFFIGDNGRCEVKGKGYLYEPGLKIPMIAWGKGVKPCEVDEIVSTLDITASVLDLAGVELPDYYQGEPLFDSNSGVSRKGEESFYGARDTWDEVVECIRSITTNDYKYIRNYMPEQGWDMHQQYLEFHRPAIHVLRDLKAKGELNEDQLLFMADHKPAEELYDLKKDPYELHNLAEQNKYRKVLKAMRSKMDEWQANNDDKGLKDRNSRTPEYVAPLSEYVKENHPEEWQKLLDGEVGENYKRYSKELKNTKTK